MTKRFLVTGTDTEIGKTVVSNALLQAVNQLGFNTAGYKLVASGGGLTAQGLCDKDALTLQRNNRVALNYEQVDPYTLTEPISPHITNAGEERLIAATTSSSGLHELEHLAGWVLVERAGGQFTLLSDTLTFANWVQQEQLPVILVVGAKLGCINHAILIAQVVHQAGLPLAGWIANDVQPPGKRHGEYLATLKNRLVVPFLGEMPRLVDIVQHDDPGQYLDLSTLGLVSSIAPAAVYPTPQHRPRRHYAPGGGHRTNPPSGG